ncbi:MAG: pyruvate kinase alpha/beta domain-containing protein [Balneolaceae bacterium]|nr:pyruvate kinase alpha/beta domain-containing protein [Balneolaceae bacterium]
MLRLPSREIHDRRIAKFRPKVNIVAFTETEKIRRQLALVWGVRPVYRDNIFDTDTDHTVRIMEQYLKKKGLVSKGDRVIIATGMPIAKRGRTNMIKVSSMNKNFRIYAIGGGTKI